MASHPEQPGHGGERVLRAESERGEHPGGDRHWQRGQHQQGQPPAAGHGLGEQQDADQRRDHVAGQPPAEHRLVGRRALHLGVVAEREGDPAQPGGDRGLGRAQAAAGQPGGHVHVRRHRVVRDIGRRGRHADLGERAQPSVPAVYRVEQHVAHARQAAAHRRRAQHDHVEDLLLLEEVAHGQAGQQGGRLAADVSGRDAVPGRGGQVDRDVQRRLLDRQLHPRRAEPAGPRDDRLDLSAQPGQLAVVRPVEPDGEGAGRRGQDAGHAVGLVGADAAGHPRHAVGDRLHLADGAIVGGTGLDRDPDLGRVGADDLVGGDRPAHGGRDVADRGQRGQLPRRPCRQPVELRQRHAGRAGPADHQVAVLELRLARVHGRQRPQAAHPGQAQQGQAQAGRDPHRHAQHPAQRGLVGPGRPAKGGPRGYGGWNPP